MTTGRQLEQTVSQAWAAVLGAGRIGPDDDFYQLGGDSLSAVRIVSRLERDLGVELSVRALLETRTVRAMTRWVQRALTEADHSST